MANEITQLLQASRSDRPEAMQALFHAVYEELKRVAHRQLNAVANPTLNTTGLVHETYLKLAFPSELELRDRAHFFAVAARAMRQIVIDHARRRHAEKRGGVQGAVTLDDAEHADQMSPTSLIGLDRALSELQSMEPRLAELVEMRFFAGLSVEQVAQLRDVTPRTIVRDWRRAKAFLFDAVRTAE
jgi:RNA polymerase sigma factor (TIGR02999 family)